MKNLCIVQKPTSLRYPQGIKERSDEAISKKQGDCFAAANAFAVLTGWAPLAMT
jgi:hypothetical protein